jgi:hypothetical protein
MSQDMLTKSINILSILDAMDDEDRATTLAMISARYQIGTGKGQNASVGKKTGKGGGEPVAPKREPEASSETDFLKEVGIKLKPLLAVLPKVTRQQGSEKPHMDLKSVQKRLNRKRAELQKELSTLAEKPEEPYYAFRSLNAIQAFRIAAQDAKATKGCRLPTDPLPNLGWDELEQILTDLASSLCDENKVGSNGFFTDEDHQFHAPSIEGEGIKGPGKQDTSNEGIPW